MRPDAPARNDQRPPGQPPCRGCGRLDGAVRIEVEVARGHVVVLCAVCYAQPMGTTKPKEEL